ncbi:MAG: HNH endonuclease [Solirubrobacterales bacterium]|nr:HNH endonuclease [Solirubrobacterales bacterium]
MLPTNPRIQHRARSSHLRRRGWRSIDAEPAGAPRRWQTCRVGRRRFSSQARVALFLAAGGRCARCGVALSAGWHADHVTPARAGGATAPANGQALCPPCNLEKGGRAG